MTDELNEFASAYVDGEATPEETALVENDERAQTAVENIRLLSSRLRSVEPQSETLREFHISTALTAFNVSAADDTIAVRTDVDAISKPDLRPDKVMSFTSRPSTNGQPKDDEPGFTDPTIQGLVGNVVPIPTKPRYQWLTSLAGAAALVLVLGVGFILLASKDGFIGSSNDAASTAGATTDSAVAANSTQVAPPAEVAEADDIANDGPGSEENAEFSDPEREVPDEVSDEAIAPSQPAADGETDLLTFDVLPDEAELQTIGSLAVLSTDYGLSSCATGASNPTGGVLIGFIPITVDGASGELLVFTSETNPRGVSVSAVNSLCELFP